MTKRNMKLASLGMDYLDDYFRGAWIHDKEKNRVLSVQRVTSQGVHCYELDLTQPYGKSRWLQTTDATYQPLELLNTFTTFSWPKLGYRNITDNIGDNYVHFFASLRSTTRGLREELLSVEASPVYARLGAQKSHLFMEGIPSMDKVAAVYAPRWVPYGEGMRKLAAGEWAAFAINEDLCISLATDISSFNGYEILFRGERVGTISSEGALSFTDKACSVKSIRKLLEKELH